MYYLNNKQETFCQSFIACHSATEAAIIAGYSENSAANQGYRLLQRDDIKKRILDIDTDTTYYNNNDIDKSSDSRRYCFIYFIAGVDSDGLELSTPVKIGITNNLKQRLRSLQTSSWVPLSVIHSSTFSNSQIVLELEQTLHECLKEVNASGEWFNLSRKNVDDLIDFIEDNKYGKDVGKRYQKKSYYVEHLQLCKNCLNNFIKSNII
jgi:hypothetical protein|tara:strand:+ start:100 stop:723 length:624 start_codon:yes stop_codon:yes gene_type:complete